MGHKELAINPALGDTNQSNIGMLSKNNCSKVCNNIFTCGKSKDLFTINGYKIKECTICGHRFSVPDVNNLEAHINSNYNEDYFFGGKAGYPNYLNEKDILIEHGEKYAKIINKIRKPGKILDVGCAAGFLLQGFINKGWQGKGIEPNEQMVKFGNEELGLNIENAPLENFEPSENFDLVSLIQVIGHFYDIDKSIENISKILSEDGLVLVESWDMASWYAKILGKNWHEYSPPTVLHWFSKATLKNLFAQHGFVPLKMGKPSKKISLKHAISLLKEKYTSNAMNKIFSTIENSIKKDIKIIYPPLDIFWILFKKY